MIGRFGSTGVDRDAVTGEVTEPAGGHLRATGVVHAQEQHRWPIGGLQTFDLGERPEPLSGEALGEQRQEVRDTGCGCELVERVDDEPLDGLRAERAGELVLEAGAAVSDEVLQVEGKRIESRAVHHEPPWRG